MTPLAALRGGERFPKGAQLLLLHEGKAEPLVAGFAASADASVSFDAKKVLFAGKKTATDPWQIWELTLADHSVRQVTTGLGRCDSTVVSAGMAAGVCAADCRRIPTAVSTPDGLDGARAD